MDPQTPPATLNEENNLLLWAALIAISIAIIVLLWLFDKFILPKLMAATVEPRIKGHEIEQLMPPVIIRISDKSNGTASTDGGGSNECAICLDEFKDGEWCRVFPQCNHEFHVPCIDAWLQRPNLTCPICRHSLEDEEALPNIAGDDLV